MEGCRIEGSGMIGLSVGADAFSSLFPLERAGGAVGNLRRME